MSTDAWRYADPDKMADPAVARELLQATPHALLAVRQRDDAVVDWPAVEAELRAALAAAGHPAGEG